MLKRRRSHTTLRRMRNKVLWRSSWTKLLMRRVLGGTKEEVLEGDTEEEQGGIEKEEELSSAVVRLH